MEINQCTFVMVNCNEQSFLNFLATSNFVIFFFTFGEKESFVKSYPATIFFLKIFYCFLCLLHIFKCTSAYVWINKIFERKIEKKFLPISFNICFGYLKEPSQ